MLRWLGWAMLGLLVIAIAAWLLSRFWPLSAAQREDVRLLEAAHRSEGRNGFALLWTLPFDGLDLAQREAALAEDLQQWQTAPAQASQASVLAARHAPLNLDGAGRCAVGPIGCLAQVRNDPQRFAEAHAGHVGLHERLARMADYDRFDSPFRPSGNELLPLPAYTPLLDGASAQALAYLQGDVAGAVEGGCRSVRFGRRMMRTSSTLMDSMMGAAVVRTHVALLGDMLVEQSPDFVLPASCEAALQPLKADEQSLCQAMQGEFAMNKAAIEASTQTAGSRLLLDRDHTLARIAGSFGWACRPAAAKALAADVPLLVPAPPQWDVGCVANPLGCTLSAIAGPHYAPYAARSQDTAAMIRLLGAQRWLRQQPGPPADALARLPAQWRSDARTPTLSADGRYVQVLRRGPARESEGPYLSMPLRVD
ncbi:hypothetical protein OHC51_17335 [Stenotrophomonas indicatrix]|uniref:hypothetical protein n=1 Tax=Stenotrophomonas indicatrix TaxID=2045451 RepID=UPI0030095FB8